MTSAEHQLPLASTRESASTRLRQISHDAGLLYTAVYGTRWAIEQLLDRVDRVLVATEQRRSIVAPWAISARRFTVADNKAVWHTHDWSSRGEEWTKSAEWKAAIVREFLERYVPERGNVVEIGAGGGRWTEFLQRRAAKVVVLDIAEHSLELCRERFTACTNIEYQLSNGRSIEAPSNSVDAIWSYDVFVHINPLDAQAYFREFHRVLKPGGRAVIHHPDTPAVRGKRRPGSRSDLTNDMVRKFIEQSALRLVSQTREYVNPGDVLSVVEKPA